MSMYSDEPPATLERLTDAIEWLAIHRTGNAGQRHELLTILRGPKWAKEHPVFESGCAGT